MSTVEIVPEWTESKEALEAEINQRLAKALAALWEAINEQEDDEILFGTGRDAQKEARCQRSLFR